MALKHLDKFKELDALLERIGEHFDWDFENESINEELRNYEDTCNAIESGNIPDSEYQSMDNDSYLDNLIELAKKDIEKYNIK